MNDAGDERTARARIRDAAIACFAEEGFHGTSVRTIAAAAEVSPALVLHHYGSKDQLKVACDVHVAEIIRVAKTAAVEAGTGLDPVASFNAFAQGPPILRYLARTLSENSPHVAELVDEMVADAKKYLQLGEEGGTIRPTDDATGRAVVLTVWSLGALVLHQHVERLLGARLTDPNYALAWARPAFEILGQGVVSGELYRHLHDQLSSTDPATPTPPTADADADADSE